MNGLQVVFVLVGLAVFMAGAYLGLSPVDGPVRSSAGAAAMLPFLDPVEAFAVRPGRVLLAAGITALGFAVALLGCYVARDRG